MKGRPGVDVGRRATYFTWRDMVARCHNPKRKDYPRYGARGVTVCDEWRASFPAFLAHMGPRPDGMQIDRINGSRGYEPGNCRWVTAKINARNRGCTRRVQFDGGTCSVPDLAERFDVDVSAVYHRLDAGWTVERAFREPGIGRYKTRTKSRGSVKTVVADEEVHDLGGSR
jgi:hypothetical protein